MRNWRLIVKRVGQAPEAQDITLLQSITAGYSPEVDICIDTIKIPFKHRLIRRNFKNPIIRLTDEALETLQGSVRENKKWSNKLYHGAELTVEDNCRFQIDDTEFLIQPIVPQSIEKVPNYTDIVARRHSQKAALYSLAGLLFFVLFTAILDWIIPDAGEEFAEKEIQKITLVEAKKMLERQPITVEKKFEEAKVTQAAAAPEPSDQSAKKSTSKDQIAAKSPGAAGEKKVRDVKSMGILALQTVKNGPSSTSLQVAEPTKTAKSLNNAVALGTGRAAFGLGSSDDAESVQIARLGQISGDGYSGDLGVKLAGQRSSAIQLARKEVEVRGALDPAVIRQIIEERLSEIRYCYETALLKHNGLEGKIAASWTIQGDGSVENLASDSEQIRQDVLHPCIRQQISRWKFPAPKGGGVVHVKYPFVFNPLGER